jgi:hypothetical protein
MARAVAIVLHTACLESSRTRDADQSSYAVLIIKSITDETDLWILTVHADCGTMMQSSLLVARRVLREWHESEAYALAGSDSSHRL